MNLFFHFTHSFTHSSFAYHSFAPLLTREHWRCVQSGSWDWRYFPGSPRQSPGDAWVLAGCAWEWQRFTPKALPCQCKHPCEDSKQCTPEVRQREVCFGCINAVIRDCVASYISDDGSGFLKCFFTCNSISLTFTVLRNCSYCGTTSRV